MFKRSSIFVLSIVLGLLSFFFTQTSRALAFEEQTSKVTSPYSFYQNDTGSYWDPGGITVQEAAGLISKGTIDVIHRGEIGILKNTVSIGATVPFIYNPDNPWFIGSGGIWDTPYGSWCAGINDRCFGDITSVGLYITSPYGNQGYLYFTGVKPPVELVSSNPAVLTCSGLSCLAKTPGQSQVTMKVSYTPIRVWARVNYLAFYVLSPEAVHNNNPASVNVWSDVSEVRAYVTAYSFTNPRLFPSTNYGGPALTENVTLSKDDFIASSEGADIIYYLSTMLGLNYMLCGECSSVSLANTMLVYFEIYLPGTSLATVQKIVDDALANGKGWSQDFKPIIIAGLPESIPFSRPVPLQNQGYNDMVLPKTTIGPWTITVEGPPVILKSKPNPPRVTPQSPVNVNVSSKITIVGTDPDGDDVRYCIDWSVPSDGDTSDTAPSGGRSNGEQCYPSSDFVPSGTSRDAYQTWNTNGTKPFKVRTEDSDNMFSDWTDSQVIVNTPPTAPVLSFTPSCIGTQPRITLSWTASVGVSSMGYRIYEDDVWEYGTTATTWPIDGLVGGVPHTYKVEARGTPLGNDSSSNTITATAQSNCAPVTADISANPMSVNPGGTTKITWSSSQAASCTVSRNGTLKWSTLFSPLGGQSDILTTLGTYTYSLSCSRPATPPAGALNSANDSVTVTVTALPPLPIPTTPNLTVLPGCSGELPQNTLSWTPSTVTPPSTVTTYNIYRDGVILKKVTSPFLFPLSYTDLGVSDGAQYTYKITAESPTAGVSNPSLPRIVTTKSNCEPVKVYLGAFPASILVGQTTSVSWLSTKANTCTMLKNGASWSTDLSTMGKADTPLLGDTIYKLTCNRTPTEVGAIDTATISTTVTATAVPLPPTATLTVNDKVGPLVTIPAGSIANVKWTSANATACSVTYIGAVTPWSGLTGNQSQTLTLPRRYNLKCTGYGSPATDVLKSVIVNISQICNIGDLQPCTTPLPGICAPGLRDCVANAGVNDWSPACNKIVTPNSYPEICDGKDNDCDNKTDEDNICPIHCGNGKCERTLGENFVNCPIDCKETVVEPPLSVKTLRPSFLAWVGNFFSSWFK